MLLRFLAAICCATVLAAVAFADTIDFMARASLPPRIVQVLEKQSAYQVDTRINPFYLQGDFDGDRLIDTAVLVKEVSSGKHGAAIVLKSGKMLVVGAGNDVGDGSNDLDWMDAWYVQPKGKIDADLTLKRDARSGRNPEAALSGGMENPSTGISRAIRRRISAIPRNHTEFPILQ